MAEEGTKSSGVEVRPKRNRWGGPRAKAPKANLDLEQCLEAVNDNGPQVSEEEAVKALIDAATNQANSATSAPKVRDRKRTPVEPPSLAPRGAGQHHSLNGGKDESQQRNGRKRARRFDLEGRTIVSGDCDDHQGNADDISEEPSKPEPKKKPDFGLSGALASDELSGNAYNGVVLKFTEPPEARIPNTRWRLYVFRKSRLSSETKADPAPGEVLQVLHVSRQSAYLFGREHRVADIPVDHPSLSKQHCVLQYRSLPDPAANNKLRCRPYLMDLASTNGTFINGVRIEDARFYELKKGDVITMGQSTREYVLLTENTTSA